MSAMMITVPFAMMIAAPFAVVIAVPFAVMIAAPFTVVIAVSFTVGPMTVFGLIAAAAVIAASATVVEAMLAPAVTVAPAGPGTHAKEDPVVEESRPIKAFWCAGVGWSFVVAVGADRRNADLDPDLCFRSRRQCQAREQCCCTE